MFLPPNAPCHRRCGWRPEDRGWRPEGTLLQDLDHGLTHGAAGAQYRYVELLTH
jgi:hypothetical protein